MNLRTVRATIVLGLLGLLVIAGLSWVVVVGPKLDALSMANEEHIALEDQDLHMRVQLASLQRLVTNLPKASERADNLAALFPPTADQPGFFAQVSEAAGLAGIEPSDLTALSPGVPVLDAPAIPPVAPDAAATEAPAEAPVEAPIETQVAMARQTVSIDVAGTYEQLSLLLGGLEKMDRAMLASTVVLTSTDDGFTMTLTGTTFVAPPLGDPPTAAP